MRTKGSGWTTKKALAELQSFAEETKALANTRHWSEGHTRWVLRTSQLLQDVFGQGSDYYRSFISLKWQRTGTFVIDSFQDGGGVEAARERIHHKAYLGDLGTARGILLAAADYLAKSDLRAVFVPPKSAGVESAAIVSVINLAEHGLRKVVREPPNHEREVQDAFENLLIGAGLDYSRESEAIEYSSKTYRPDFVLHGNNLVVELKLCNRGGREKEIIAEINDDILAYQQKFQSLLFVIYDCGVIRDVDRFTSSFEAHKNVIVRVVKH